MTCTESVTERAAMRILWLNALLHLIHYIIVQRTKVNVFSYDKTLPFKSTIVAHDGFCSVRFGLCSVLKQREESVSPWQNMSRKKRKRKNGYLLRFLLSLPRTPVPSWRSLNRQVSASLQQKTKRFLCWLRRTARPLPYPEKQKRPTWKKKKYINKEVNNSCSKLFSQSVYENEWL